MRKQVISLFQASPPLLVLIIFPLFALLFTNCSSTKDINPTAIIGDYQRKFKYNGGPTLSLKADRTFEYYWQQGLIGGTTTGKWNLEKNILILHSDRQPNDEVDYRIIEMPRTVSDSFEIKVVDGKNQEVLPYANCALLKDSIFIAGEPTDDLGQCELPSSSEANYISIQYISYKQATIPIKDLPSYSFIVEMIDALEGYVYFTQKRLKVKGNRLYDPELKASKYDKPYYKKK